MAVQAAFLPLLGAAARVIGTRAFLSMGGRSLAKSFAASQAVNVADLGRKLGTPVPSQQQIQAEKFRLAQENLVQFAGSVAKATGTVIKFAALAPIMASIAGILENAVGGVLSRRQAFEQVNSGIAASFAQMRRQDLVLGVRTGQGIAPSTRGLANAFMDLKEDIRPLTEVGVRIGNVLGTTIVTLARGLVLILTPLTWTLDKILDVIDLIPGVSVPTPESQAGLQHDLRDFFRQMRTGNFGNPINQRPGSSRRLP